jgi:hypothetical protein
LNVCDDTLGGIPAVDARKFAQDYVQQRTLEEQKGSAGVSSAPQRKDPSSAAEKSEFTIVKKKSKKKSVNA